MEDPMDPWAYSRQRVPAAEVTGNSVDIVRMKWMNFTLVVILLQVIFNLSSVTADPRIRNVVNVQDVTAKKVAPFISNDYKEVCGRRMMPQARIIGGRKSKIGQWPWQILLQEYQNSTYQNKCGAALLNENWAITAAQCVYNVLPFDLLLRLGEYDMANEDEPYGFVERRVESISIRVNYNPEYYFNDIALLRFSEPVKFQPNILPVCIPDNDDDDYVGQTAYVTGWGLVHDEGSLPSVLHHVEVPVIKNTECEAMYKATGYNEHIPDIFICAGKEEGGVDNCKGDSGGPMVFRREGDGRFVLGGIISWGIGCAEPNHPGVYTRVSKFLDWINELLFSEPVTFQPNILPVCLPDNDEDYAGQTAYVTGWGASDFDSPLSTVLNEVEIPVLNNTVCKALFKLATYDEYLPNTFVCAGKKEGGVDHCRGDSRRPMVLQRERDSRFVLGGIVSWGIGCGKPNLPGVYTRISKFRDWINQILET